MDAFIYQADLYCEDCAVAIMARLTEEGKRPADPFNEHTYDSDNYPKGPYPDGGGEADYFAHCAECREFLCNPLTSEGVRHVTEALDEYLAHKDGAADVLDVWAEELRDYALTPDQTRTLHAYRAIRTRELARAPK
jgi:hypothetical protein